MQKLFWRGLIGILLISSLFACATSSKSKMGTKEITEDEILAQIKPGQSTKEDVKALLGTPQKFNFTDNDEEIWEYMFRGDQQKHRNYSPLSFIPIPYLGTAVGAAQGMKGTRQANTGYQLTIRFTKEGIVKAMGRGEIASESSTRTGL